MKTINPINLSPSFLAKVLSNGYDYAVGEKLGMFGKDTAAMSDGRLLHAIIAEKLGGEPAKIAISPYASFRTNEAKAWRDSQPDDTAIVSEAKMEQFNAIAERAINHPKIAPYLKDCKPEVKIEKEVNGYNVKGILDVISSHNGKTVIDWKFVSTQVFDSFDKKALYQNYDLQSSVYDFLTDATHVLFAVIENEAPHRIKLWNCDSSFLESGADKFNKSFKIVQEAKWREPQFDILEVDDLMSWNNYVG